MPLEKSVDITAISALLTSLKTATDVAKLIRESGATLEAAETKLKLADLVEALVDVKLQASDVRQLLIQRDEEIKNLKDALEIKKNLRWEQPCYYLQDGKGKEDPFCQKCFDATGNLSRLHTDGEGHFVCMVCEQSFKTLARGQADRRAEQNAIDRHNNSHPW